MRGVGAKKLTSDLMVGVDDGDSAINTPLTPDEISHHCKHALVMQSKVHDGVDIRCRHHLVLPCLDPDGVDILRFGTLILLKARASATGGLITRFGHGASHLAIADERRGGP